MCDEIIGIINLKKIKYPLTGDMIKSPDAAHGFPDPFYPGCEFEFMRCPYGGHRPMILPNTVLLDINRILNITPTGFSLSPVGSDRDYILDREQLFSPVGMMSDEEAEARARGNNISEESKDNGKTEIQQGQTEDTKPIEIKTEAKDLTTPFSSDGNPPANYCVACNKQFTKSGYTNHMRIKHKEKVNAG
jgi:hypothetical protein